MLLDGRKFVMIYYGASEIEVLDRLESLFNVLAFNVGEANVRIDRLHREIFTPKCCIKGICDGDILHSRLDGLRADECFSFGGLRVHYVSKAAIEKGPYKGTIIDYILEVESNPVTARPEEELRRELPEWFKDGVADELKEGKISEKTETD